MKHLQTIKLLLATIFFFGLGLTNQLLAQNMYLLTGKPVLTVMGGSTIHNWEMASAQAKGTAEMLVEGAAVKQVKSATITMKAESLKSGKDKMDEIAYDALNTKKHPEIKFVLTSLKNLGNNKALATGNLTIAGTTKQVTFKVTIKLKGLSLNLDGTTAIKFTDFGIKPPTAMLGTIKTDNDLKLQFKVDFQQAALQ